MGVYPYLCELLSDKTGGDVFRCFGPWHFFWIGLTAAVFVFLYRRLRSREDRERVLDRLSGLAFGLYVLDFFLMPLAYGGIDVEKLPFHACTAMCVMVFLSRRCPRLDRYRGSFAVLGFVSNVIYLLYPAGVMWHAVHPLCYRVVQTLLFHALMSISCLLELLFGGTGRRRTHLAVTAGMTLWAMLGNFVYNSGARFYNWFFVAADPFGLIPGTVSPFVMPVLNIVLFFCAELAVCALADRIREVRHAV